MPFNKVLGDYFPSGVWKITEGQSGWNNTTRFIEAEGNRWVLRIYETHKDLGKIDFEHQILQALNKLELPYGIPEPVCTINADRSDTDYSSTVVPLADGSGRLACLFTYIEGRRPHKQDKNIVHAIGVAAGQLSVALSSLQVSRKAEYPPYYAMDEAHPSCSPAEVSSFCFEGSPEFRSLREQLQLIGEAITGIRTSLPMLRELPHQLIHGDINYSNLLVTDDTDDIGTRIAAILDFEFCTEDLRVMEFAVIVSSLLFGEMALADITSFLSGVGEVIQLEQVEAEALPLLVELRILDVFQHFLGRYLDGVDEISVLSSQIQSTYDGLRALARMKVELKDMSMTLLTC